MLSKFKIALKECSETEGWLQLLFNEEVKRFCRHFDTIEFPIFHREYEYKKILCKKKPQHLLGHFKLILAIFVHLSLKGFVI